MIICMTLLIVPVYFPMWGGMLCPPREGVVEEVRTEATSCALCVNVLMPHAIACARMQSARGYSWLQRVINLAMSKFSLCSMWFCDACVHL